MEQYLEKPGGFMGSNTGYPEALIVLLGAPMDLTVSYRPGTRMGPQQIRAVSIGLEEYSIYLDKQLSEVSFADLGDVAVPFGNVNESLERIRQVIERVLEDGKKPFVIGGEHLISYPVIQAIHHRYSDLMVVHFDAHADLRKDYVGEANSHATVMRKTAELLGPKRIIQVGIRSGIKEEFEYAQENTHLFKDRLEEAMPRVKEIVGDRPLYISLDIDVVDPAFAPGTGTPEPGGCTAREIISAVHSLRDCRVVGLDLVEVSPVYDPSERTALLGAKLLREAILCFG
ncbi:MAG: agmatinase [Syntrophomonadaceae bacterium]|nr:agmatinase [Syntrophomonadaceae bacterium]